jgi:hypothetical protein
MKKLLIFCALLSLVGAFSCRKKKPEVVVITPYVQAQPTEEYIIYTEDRISGPMPADLPIAWDEEDLK